MYSAPSRANAIFAYTTFVLGGLLFLNVVSRLLLPSNPVVSLKLNKFENLRKHYGSDNDQVVIYFDLKADLTTLFNWNTKQLFVYVTAEYSTPTNKFNQLIIWDKIIRSKDDAMLDLVGQTGQRYNRPMYDNGRNLRGANLTLSFHWDETPITGILLPGQLGSQNFKLASQYSVEL
eukprot:TRINITY_DN24139_c0_g1_i1.p1 TRINITY_DN24139_c0_g1~~TRINITY_DN24139_c0_g1_i1.p1  ORF type:complete len:203 (+),score=25.75 TRINITY_DN24139_c0_g1_i1:83-610(+)